MLRCSRFSARASANSARRRQWRFCAWALARSRAGKLGITLLSEKDQVRFRQTFARLKKDRDSVTPEELEGFLSNPAMAALAFQQAGGQINFFGLEDVEHKTRDIIESVKNIGDGKKGSDKGLIKNVFNWINDVNTGVENSVRLQAFKSMLRDGATLQDAAFRGGREGTVDFTRKGNWANALNALFPFYKAGISGNARLVKALFKGGPEARKAGLGLAIRLTSFGFMYSLLMRWYAGEDEETEEQHWDRLSNWEKKHYLNIFMKPGGDGARIALPMPYGWNQLVGTGSMMADVAMYGLGNTDRKYGPLETALEVMSSTVDTFSPMSGGNVVTRFVPHAVRPIAEIAMNENFLGNEISPEQHPWGAPKPDSQLAWGTVNPMTRDAMQTINKATGGDEYEPGMIDVSPETIDHVVQYYTGTMGTKLWDLAGISYAKAKGENAHKPFLKSVPVVSRLFKPETNDYSTEGRYMTLSKIVDIKTNKVAKLIKQGDRKRALDEKRKNKNYFILEGLMKAQNSRKEFWYRQIASAKKAKANRSKIQQLEDRLRKEQVGSMAKILKKARELDIYV